MNEGYNHRRRYTRSATPNTQGSTPVKVRRKGVNLVWVIAAISCFSLGHNTTGVLFLIMAFL